MMREQYTVVNLCAGIGSMSWAFEHAGFQVIYNLVRNHDEENIIRRNFEVETGSPAEMMWKDFPTVDIVIGNFPWLQDFSRAGTYFKEPQSDLRKEIFQFALDHIRPKAFLFNMSIRMKNTETFRYLTEQLEREGYDFFYKELEAQEVTGMPIRDRKIYFTAIRKDINVDFSFPQSFPDDYPFPMFLEEETDGRYDIKDEKLFLECQEDGLYVWKKGKYQREEVVRRELRVPLIRTGGKLRRITSREMARLKGIPDSYELPCSNRNWLYNAIWQEPHTGIISLLAEELHRALEKEQKGHTESGALENEQKGRTEPGGIKMNHDIRSIGRKIREENTVERRFDVFVSSTYEDLIEERKEVTQAILECDCMPVGMEMFPASNLEQWNFIKKVIDKSDIYLVIIAGRYGSVNRDGAGRKVSYTEMEFDYALEQGKPILAFLVDDIGKLQRDRTEADNDKMDLLTSFRAKVKTDRLVKFYKNKDDLKAKVMGSLNQMKKQINSGGWVRADEKNHSEVEDLTKKIQILEEEKKALRTKNSELQGMVKDYSGRMDAAMQSHALMKTKLEEIHKNFEDFKEFVDNLGLSFRKS